MAETEEPYPDPRLEQLIRESGLVWPRDDAQLDTWLAAQQLPESDEAWLKEVVLRRLQETRLPGGAAQRDLGAAEPGQDLGVGKALPAPVAARGARRLSYDDLALLNGQLLELVEAGVPLPTGLEAYAHDVQGGRLEAVLETLRQDLEQGLPLSGALERQGAAFPPLYRSLIAAGEAGGDLGAALGLLHEQAEVDAELDRRLKEALAYPAIAFAGAVGGLVAIAYILGPSYEDLWAGMGMELPWLTEFFLAGSSFLREHTVFTLVAAGLAILSVFTLGPRLAPRLVRFTSGWWTPSRSLGEMARALAGFLHRGLPLDQALAALEHAELRFPQGTLGRLRERVEAGEGLAASLQPEAIFPGSFVWIVGAAERRGDLAETLHVLAQRQEREFQRKVRALEVLVGPLALAGTGILVSIAALSIYLPMFELQRALSQ